MVDKDMNEVNDSPVLKFLERVKNGEYAQIERTSLLYARIKEETEVVDPYTETYYYGIS